MSGQEVCVWAQRSPSSCGLPANDDCDGEDPEAARGGLSGPLSDDRNGTPLHPSDDEEDEAEEERDFIIPCCSGGPLLSPVRAAELNCLSLGSPPPLRCEEPYSWLTAPRRGGTPLDDYDSPLSSASPGPSDVAPGERDAVLQVLLLTTNELREDAAGRLRLHCVTEVSDIAAPRMWPAVAPPPRGMNAGDIRSLAVDDPLSP